MKDIMIILAPLLRPLSGLPGIGSKTAEHFNRLVGKRVIDLLLHAPSDLHHYASQIDLSQQTSQNVCLEVIIKEHMPGVGKRPYEILCTTKDHIEISLIFFHGKNYLPKNFPKGAKKIVFGKLESSFNKKTIFHPNIKTSTATQDFLEVIYPLTYGLTTFSVKKTIDYAIQTIPELPEWLPEELIKHHQLPSWKEAIKKLHNPKTNEDLSPFSKERLRLAIDEIFFEQIMLYDLQKKQKQDNGFHKNFPGRLSSAALDILPFQLTQGQTDALIDIRKDLRSDQRMLRMIQGDVGCGKTIVAFLAALDCVESQGQVALLVPTEVLAKQHHNNLKKYCDILGLQINLLVGQTKTKEKHIILDNIATGKTNIVIGTHALLESNIIFHSLSLAIIDEQHRFGVSQRSALIDKGGKTDILVMTATPIPRTLKLTQYNDLEVSIISQKPENRKEIKTVTLHKNKINEIISRFHEILQKGEKVYWVCPLIEESETLNLQNIDARFEHLKKYFEENQILLMHGKMSAQEKESVMSDFNSNGGKILISTTVIEVGVDVKDATVIVIEDAQRFGLAQLHQLRGRVGRSEKASSCILLYDFPLSNIAKERLNIMRQTNDGFLIAEKDLELRGSGDLFGTRQSGALDYRFFEPFEQIYLVEEIADLIKKGTLISENILFLRKIYERFVEKDIRNAG